MSTGRFDDAAIDAVYRTIHSRRDIREFIPGALPDGLLERLYAATHAAWEVALGYMHDPAINLVVLDEMTSAFKYQWLPPAEMLAAFATRPPMQHVIVTGCAAPEALVAAADTVTEMRLVKHAFKTGVKAMPEMGF